MSPLSLPLMMCCSVTAFAAGDPITVVNNLSDFIFRTHSCDRSYPARLGIVPGRSVFGPRPVSSVSMVSLTLAGGVIITFIEI